MIQPDITTTKRCVSARLSDADVLLVMSIMMILFLFVGDYESVPRCDSQHDVIYALVLYYTCNNMYNVPGIGSI